jgi:cleavage stimulation factor subunit 2
MSIGLTEEQIIQICSTVGQVLSFRLVYDTDTGRPKGFGFVEFADSDAAASAVRNLDKYPIQGRELRVDYSHVGGKDETPSTNFQSQAQNLNGLVPPASGPNPTAAPNIVGPLPMGAELPPGITCPDAISKTLSTLPPPQLLDILSQMKSLVVNDPVRATELLKQAPQLSYAIFQALLLMGLVDSSLIASVVESSNSTVPVPPPTATPSQMPTRPYQPPPTQYGTPPVPPTHYQPPAPPQPPALPPGQEELIRQLLSMPQTEIDKLGPAERAQVMALKAQYGGLAGGY